MTEQKTNDVILVEDDDDQRYLLQVNFPDWTTIHPSEVDTVDFSEYEVLVTDWRMEPPGEYVAEKALSQNPDILVLVMSANTRPPTELNSRIKWLTKPFKLERLLEVIKNARLGRIGETD